MMPSLLTCDIAQDAMPYLKQLRLEHLRYIAAHLSEILFGGPARHEDGSPETMIIVLHTDDRAKAMAFLNQEPYNASGKVFRQTTIRRWSQVAPPATAKALIDAIAEKARTAGADLRSGA